MGFSSRDSCKRCADERIVREARHSRHVRHAAILCVVVSFLLGHCIEEPPGHLLITLRNEPDDAWQAGSDRKAGEEVQVDALVLAQEVFRTRRRCSGLVDWRQALARFQLEAEIVKPRPDKERVALGARDVQDSQNALPAWEGFWKAAPKVLEALRFL